MDGRERSDTCDEFDAEVSDVRRSRGDAVSPPPARSLARPRLPRRRRRGRLAGIVSAGLLALAVVLGSVPSVRERVVGLIPTATPTLAPGADLFYLLPNPPGVGVSLDGHALPHLPFPGDAHPLRVAPSHHVFAWRSRIFPFKAANCMISVPLSASDTCPFLPSQQLPPTVRSLAGRIITMQVSLSSLSILDQYLLTMAIRGTLDNIRLTGVVQPSERYDYYATGAPAGRAVVATQPLHVTLGYHSILTSGYPDPCLVGQLFIPCRAPAEDCSQLCTLPGAPQTASTAPAAWIAGGAASSTWNYATLGGQVVAGGEAVVVHVAALGITGDGATGHVPPPLGLTPGLPATDEPGCKPARYWLEQNGRWAFMMADARPGTAQFVSDATPTDRCLVVLDPQPGADVAAAFLQRLGEAIAVKHL